MKKKFLVCLGLGLLFCSPVFATDLNSPTPAPSEYLFEDFNALTAPEVPSTEEFCINVRDSQCRPVKYCCPRGGGGLCSIIIPYIECDKNSPGKAAYSSTIKKESDRPRHNQNKRARTNS
ncbi:MAG: hypothetical protein HQM16_10050 [Deltaproteobacteria bacterium]|nr:hypothetical protein [Deltaproteobacteria bacterium]